MGGPRIGPYEIEGDLGSGGMGRVYRVRHAPTGAVRALKVLEGDLDPESVARFRREYEALAALGGDGVVPIHDAGFERGRMYFAMALVEGGSLRARLARVGRLPWREAVALMVPLARALERCHAAGVVHRDVKPDNILVDAEGRPWLADFGCVRDLARSQLTEPGTTLGTYGYMAPEQLQGNAVGGAADVYALGVVLDELVRGECLFQEGTSTVAHLRAREGRRPRLTASGAPQELDSLLDAALAVQVADRPRAGSLARGLEALLTTPDKAARRGFARPLLTVAAVALVGLGAAIVALPAREPGVAEDQETARAAATATREAAARHLAEGRPEQALEALARAGPEALPEPPATQLVRGRSLLALGRLDAVGPVVSSLLLARDPAPEWLELGGDLARARRDFPEARKLFGQALDRATGRAGLDRELHARRGATATQAGDDGAALADLRALLGKDVDDPPPFDPDEVASSRARNADLAALAPALYRRYLAQPLERSTVRGYDAAVRIAPPPADLEAAVAASLRERTGQGSVTISGFWEGGMHDPRIQAQLRSAADWAFRASFVLPTTDLVLFWNDGLQLRQADAHGQSHLARVRESLEGWKENPITNLLDAIAAKDASRPEEALASANRGLRGGLRVMAPPGDAPEPYSYRHLLADLVCDAASPGPNFGTRLPGFKVAGADLDLLVRGAERARSPKAWANVLEEYFEAGIDRARSERLVAATERGWPFTDDLDFREVLLRDECMTLRLLGDHAKAVVLARAHALDVPELTSEREVVVSLETLEDWAGIVAAMNATPALEGVDAAAIAWVHALVELGRRDEAGALTQRLCDRGSRECHSAKSYLRKLDAH